jgi:hypothetical protein
MKFVTKWLSFITLFASLVALNGCGGDDPEKSEEEVQLDKLRGTWTMATVVNDGVDRSDEYTGMTMAIAGTFTTGGTYNYTSLATKWPSVSPWKASDNWKFNTSNFSGLIVRQSDLLDMNYALTNSDTGLKIEFDYTGTGFNNGRTESVGGHWVFTFSK